MRIGFGILLCTFTLAASGESGTQAGEKSVIEKELKKFQGTWIFESVEAGGKKVDIAGFKGMTVTFEGDRFLVKQGDKVIQTATQKLDPSKSPKTLDVMVIDGLNKGSAMLGIYEFRGDTLWVCFDPEGKTRPTKFETTGVQTLVVHKRVMK